MKKFFVLSICCVFSASTFAEPELKGTPAELTNYLDNVKNYIVLQGTSQIEVPADRAIVKIRIKVEDKTFQGALKKNKAIETSVIKALQQSGISSDRIITSAFSSVPEYGYFSSKVSTYNINNTIKIKVENDKDLQQIARQVDNHKEVEYAGMEFEHSQRKKLQNDAVEKACDDLKAKKSMYEKKFEINLILETFYDASTATSKTFEDELDKYTRKKFGGRLYSGSAVKLKRSPLLAT